MPESDDGTYQQWSCMCEDKEARSYLLAFRNTVYKPIGSHSQFVEDMYCTEV